MTSYKPLIYAFSFVFILAGLISLLSFYVDLGNLEPSGIGATILNLFESVANVLISVLGVIFSVADLLINAIITFFNAFIYLVNFFISDDLPLIESIDISGLTTDFFTQVLDYFLEQINFFFAIPDQILVPLIILITFGIIWTLWAMFRGN